MDTQFQYRVIFDQSWKVQVLRGDGWETAYFCKSEESANRQRTKCEIRAIAWGRMTEDERMRSILRSWPQRVRAAEVDRHLAEPIAVDVDLHRRRAEQRFRLEAEP